MRRKSNAKKAIIFSFVVAFLVCSAPFIFSEKEPRIQFKEEQKDFGKVKQGAVLTHAFVFKNIGDETLRITKVTSSCGCTAAMPSDKEIAPGKSSEVKVTFNTRGYGGKLSKYVQIRSNDPKNPIKQLTVSADIEVPPQPRIELAPYSLDLGLFLESDEIQARAKIKNKGERELSVEFNHREASFFSEGKEISSLLKIAAGKEKEVEIRIPPRKRAGLLREYILLKTNDPRRPSLSLYMSGYVITKNQLKELFARYKDILNK